MHLLPLLAENSLFKAVGQIFHPLFVAVAAVLAWIYGVVPNFAAAIALLTVLIMALLTPLTIKSTRSMVAMQALQPEMQKLRQKYKGAENREQLNQEMMRLYREHGVSPTGGCLPMFLQMPALIVLYDTIKGLANSVAFGAKFPSTTLIPMVDAVKGTGKKASSLAARIQHSTGLVNVSGMKCVEKAHGCAIPRYVPTDSLLYRHLVATPGVIKSIGLNLAAKPLTHHGNWYGYVPYFALVVAAVGLQYFQMAQMTRRNRNSQQQVPQQMQTMQRVMPLIFAYIYFIVPAGVVIYMIVSSGIRVLTQDLIFRYGLVQRPGERKIGGGVKAPGRPAGVAIPAEASVVPAKGAKSANGQAGNGAGGAKPVLASNKQAAAPVSRAGGTAGVVRRQRTGSGRAQPPPAAIPKAHPRSKSKRARKAR